MNLTQLIQHPELMDRDTLYDLRSLIALYPYYQTARLLMLQNLYVLHDPTFDEELRKAAIYITDRKVIFNLIEAAHYKLKDDHPAPQPAKKEDDKPQDRTALLIDNFLESLPLDEEEEAKKKKRKPTPADAAVDYVSYLLETESEEEKQQDEQAPQMKGQELIDNFINNDGGKIELKEEPEYLPEVEEPQDDEPTPGEGYYTETLARIYIQQGKFERALDIITRLNLNNSKKSVYFADQIRFLKKLIRNEQAGARKQTDKKIKN